MSVWTLCKGIKYFFQLFARNKVCIYFWPNIAVMWIVQLQPQFTEAILEQIYLAVPHITTH